MGWTSLACTCLLYVGAGGAITRAREDGGAAPNVFVNPHGHNSLRIRVSFGDAPLEGLPGALIPAPEPTLARSSTTPSTVRSGNIEARFVSDGTGSHSLTVTRISDNTTLLDLVDMSAAPTRAPTYYAWRAEFVGWEGEKLFGMGERPTLRNTSLDLKGLNISFKQSQTNKEFTVPFLVSNRKFGVFWNVPSFGTLDLSTENRTIWTAECARQIDIWVTTTTAAPSLAVSGGYSTILQQYYTFAVGLPNALPEWALGLWASKQRYASQTEILKIANNYSAHGITPSVVVIDWKHYNCVGDWAFTLNVDTCWPDPRQMLSDLRDIGVDRVFVSVHPWSEPGSRSFSALQKGNYCLVNASGDPVAWGGWSLPTCKANQTPENKKSATENKISAERSNCLYDPTLPAAREAFFGYLNESYVRDGIVNFWTDGTEPAGPPPGGLPADAVFRGLDGGVVPSRSAWLLWPTWHAKTFFQGVESTGVKEEDNWSLARSVWAGSHKSNVIVWSGDIGSTWDTLATQVRIGQNVQLTYPYWNTDVGGFKNGDWEAMGELISRWFQFSIFFAIMRLHGDRRPKRPDLVPLASTCDPTGSAGGPIEPWVYGESAFKAIKVAIGIRSDMRKYIRDLVTALSTRGQPLMRPLWYEFPDDGQSEDAAGQFMFGSQYLVAPVVRPGITSKRVYFPPAGDNAKFVHYFTNKSYPADGSFVDVPVDSLDTFPLFELKFA